MLLCPLCRDTRLDAHMVGATEVDTCPTCRGIWLDRGELDRLLDGADRPTSPRSADDDRARSSSAGGSKDSKQGKKKAKKSRAERLADLFEEVLDF